MTKQQTIDYLKDQIESLHAAIKAKTEIIEDLKLQLHSLPYDIEEEHYQKFKTSDIAKYMSRYVEELISDNLKICGDDEPSYSGYYSLKLLYKDKLISDFDGQIYTGRNPLDD